MTTNAVPSPEQGLAQMLGVTRNVPREAVKMLAAMGRVSVRRGAGIFAAGPSRPRPHDAPPGSRPRLMTDHIDTTQRHFERRIHDRITGS